MVVLPEVSLKIRQTFDSSMLVMLIAGLRIVLSSCILDDSDAIIELLIEVE